ncbi:MAG: FoF1 ATP synthase subunit a [Dehalococcoidales bacterium]|nr:FoF1 ATP synthase subunit a [Dehalococcoidales bacterium]
MPKQGRPGFKKPLIILGVIALFLVGFLAGPVGKSIFGDVGLPNWLSVSQPHPELPPEVVFHLFGFPITNTVISAWLTIIVVAGFSFAVTRRLKLIPKKLQALLEFILGSLMDLCQNVAGDRNGRRFFPIVATIFLFVMFNGWLSLFPGFGSILVHTAEGEVHLLRSANTDINLPLSIAIVSFLAVGFFGFKSLGPGYLTKFINVGQFLAGLGQLGRGKLGAGMNGIFLGAINMFIGLIHLLSEFVRIISFTLRLFGNMTAGEILLIMVTFLVPFLAALPFYGLELLVGFVQALIFGMLTLIFLTLAVVSHGDESH